MKGGVLRRQILAQNALRSAPALRRPVPRLHPSAVCTWDTSCHCASPAPHALTAPTRPPCASDLADVLDPRVCVRKPVLLRPGVAEPEHAGLPHHAGQVCAVRAHAHALPAVCRWVADCPLASCPVAPIRTSTSAAAATRGSCRRWRWRRGSRPRSRRSWSAGRRSRRR